jgi:hypothetical protein
MNVWSLLSTTDAGVYFAVLVGPVSGSFAAQRADTVSGIEQNNVLVCSS